MGIIRLDADAERGADLRRLMAEACAPPDPEDRDALLLAAGRPDLWRPPRAAGRRWLGSRPLDDGDGFEGRS